MSIANEITALNTNLTAAKNAVTAKGGTVGDTGLAGLAAEIASIPSGGAIEYGEVTYLDENDVQQTLAIGDLVDAFSFAPTISGRSWTATVNDVSISKDKIIAFEIGKALSVLPDNFLENCTELTSITFEEGCTLKELPSHFCTATKITSISIPSSVNSTGTQVLMNNHLLTSLTIPATLENIGSNFCQNCVGLTTISGLSTVKTIGSSFCSGCSALNCPMDLSAVTSIDSSFLIGCTSFNSTITINSNYTGQLSRFLSGCTSFNKAITIPSGTTNVSYFLTGCTSFNQPLTIPSGITSVANVLYGCSSFNSTLTMGDNITSAQYLLYNCSSFNQPITIGGTGGELSNISYALYGCTSLNSTVAIQTSSNVTRPSINFFMYNCNAMTARVYVYVNMSGAATNTNAMATTDNTAPCYTQGIPIGGTYASDWKNKCPNRTSSPYRNLI